jgi:hypothetical protein
MTTYPVRFSVPRPARFTRVQLVVRIVLFSILGLLGLSQGVVFLAAYLALPAFAALRLSANRDPARYLAEDGARVLGVLRWFMAINAYFGLASDALPMRSPQETVRLDAELAARPDARSALWRIITGIPSALVLAVLGCIAGFVWLIAAVFVLVHQRYPDWAFAYLEGMQRWAARLLAYQASLVDEYPPFSLGPDETAAPMQTAAS